MKVKVLDTQSLSDFLQPSRTVGSSVHGILQARILEWVASPFSRGSSQPKDWTLVSHFAGRFLIAWATREALIFPNALNSGKHSKVTAYCKEANIPAWQQCQQTHLYGQKFGEQCLFLSENNKDFTAS